jgi:hypothetical protein
MRSITIEVLNDWGAGWAVAMGRSLVEATVVLVFVGLAATILR